MEVMGIFPGTISQGNELLNQGHILAIAPGFFLLYFYYYLSSHYYDKCFLIVCLKKNHFFKNIKVQIPNLIV